MIIELTFLILYKLLIDYTYVKYVKELYFYQGFTYDFNLIKFIESIICLISLYIYYRINNKTDHVTNIILLIIIVSLFVPYSVLYGMENTNRLLYYVVYISFIITILITKIPPIKFPSIYINEKINIKILFGFSLLVLTLLIFFVGFPSLHALNLNNVYEIRRESTIPRGLSYLLNWQAKIISLFIIAYGLYYKRKKLVVTMIIIQILIYTITAHKIILFSPFLLVAFYVMLRCFNNFKLIYILFMNAGVFISFLFFKLNISEWPATLFIRRMLLVPVKNTNYVFEYFSDIEKIKLSNSILRGIFIYPFDKGVYYLIGEKYYNNPLTNANASYIGDAYLQFGILGIILYSILLGVLLWFLKSVSIDKPRIIVLGAVLIGFYSIIDSSLLTSMLTNGIMLGLILCIFLNKVK